MKKKYVTLLVCDEDGDVLERMNVVCPPDLDHQLTCNGIFEVLEVMFDVEAYEK